jgi:DhnA family fructose-bisphosphate aldolase class Ia
MVEPVLWGQQIPPHLHNASEMVAHAARVAFELGADVLKLPIPEELHALENLCQTLPVPVLVMGGPLTDTTRLLHLIEGAMDAGAAGVALGRNVWQHPHPQQMIEVLKQIVHQGLRSKDALELLRY